MVGRRHRIEIAGELFGQPLVAAPRRSGIAGCEIEAHAGPRHRLVAAVEQLQRGRDALAGGDLAVGGFDQLQRLGDDPLRHAGALGVSQ